MAEIKSVIEAMLFAADKPLNSSQLQNCFDKTDRPGKSQIQSILNEISEDYRGRPIELKEVASGFRFQVRQEFSPWVLKLFEEKPARYSRAVLETLAVIAYQQPATRGVIEDIRGVSVSSSIMRTLLDRGWIRIVGHKEVPGRPVLYATSKQFLDDFNLKSIDDIPVLCESQMKDEPAEREFPYGGVMIDQADEAIS